MRRALVVVTLLLLPALLAGCAFPQDPQPVEGTLTPTFKGIDGLTPEPRSHPMALHVSADGQRAFVALAGTIARPDDRIAVIDLARGALETHIEVGPRPLGFAADPVAPDRLLVAHPYAEWLSVIDTRDAHLAGSLPVPFYIEDIAFSPDGSRLIAVDRDQDRLIVYAVDREDDGFRLDERNTFGTGPNPAKALFVPPPEDADWDAGRMVAVTDRHGASLTLIDLDHGQTRRLDTGGAPLAIAARDGLVFVAGYAPGNGTGIQTADNRTIETGTAAIENSLLVVDLRRGPDLLAEPREPIDAHRYLSDTAHPERGHGDLHLLGGASPRALHFDDTPQRDAGNDTATLWVAYHGSDQVQALRYTAPGADDLSADVLATLGGLSGERLSHVAAGEPLVPGRLGDIVHGMYETPPGPIAVARSDSTLVVVAELPELLHLTHLGDCPGPAAPLAACRSLTVAVVDDPRPYPEGPFETGERLFFSALPSADQDRACASCHVEGLDNGGTAALPHRDGEPVRVPRLDQTADNAPWLYDGSITRPEQYLDAAGGDLLRPDAEDPHNLAIQAPPETLYPGAAERLGALADNVTGAEDYMRTTWAFALGEERMLPAPPRLTDAATSQGVQLFYNDRASCVACHLDDGERANLLSAERSADIPRPANAEQIKAPALGGLWDRQGAGFLYDGRATTLHEALLPEGHRCLRSTETGLETAWHGDLQERTCDTVDALMLHLLAHGARR